MFRLLKGFYKTDHSLLFWMLWLVIVLATVLIYGFTVGGVLSPACLCILWGIVSAVDILFFAQSRHDTFPRRGAYALLKGFGAMILAVILYTTLNRLSPTLVTSYETYAQTVKPARNEITVTFTDPDGQEQTGEIPDYGCLAVDIPVAVGDGILVTEYRGIFGLSWRTVERSDPLS